MKILRSYERIAEKEHWCDCCCNYIHPGEMYHGEVQLREEKAINRISVFKSHINPCCDFPPDPEEDRDSEREEKESGIESKLKKAA